jgi:hypothetical protein
MSFDTLDLITGNVFQVTWDLGRRCNYDCSYCPAHRHDNFSKHATLEELKSNTDFLFEYVDTYMQHRKFKSSSISFTGGEPTVNPNFIPFIQYLKQKYEEFYPWWEANWELGIPEHYRGKITKKDFMNADYGLKRLEGMLKFMESEDWSVRLDEMKEFLDLCDAQRGIDFATVFPEMTNIFKKQNEISKIYA